MNKESDFVDLLNKCKNRRKYEAQTAEMQNKLFILYSMLYETLEKQGCDNVASQIDQMTGWTYDKEADWLKGNRNYDQLKQQLAEKDKEIAYLTKQVKKFNNEAQKYFEDAYCNDFHNQDKISFALDILEELADCSNYINSKLDFESGSYVSEKSIRDKIKYLKAVSYTHLRAHET